MILTQNVQCPYCGESFKSMIDVTAGAQEYTEDCTACSRPVTLRASVDHAGELLAIEIRPRNN